MGAGAYLLARLAGSKYLRWAAFAALGLLAVWFAIRRREAMVAKIAALSAALETLEESHGSKERMAEALARTPRDYDSLMELLRRGEG